MNVGFRIPLPVCKPQNTDCPCAEFLSVLSRLFCGPRSSGVASFSKGLSATSGWSKERLAWLEGRAATQELQCLGTHTVQAETQRSLFWMKMEWFAPRRRWRTVSFWQTRLLDSLKRFACPLLFRVISAVLVLSNYWHKRIQELAASAGG